MCDDYHNHFRARVRQARPQIPEHFNFPGEPMADLLDGRVMTGTKALACGLIDRLGYLDDAVAAARELAKQPAARVVLFHRSNDPAFSQYAITPNTPLQGTAFPFSIPGAERSKLPTFLFMWLAEPTAERISGR
jgi:protease-4